MLGPEHPDSLDTRSNLASALLHQGKYTESETEDREVVKLYEKVLGPEHPNTLEARNNLAEVLAAQTRYVEAEAEYRAVIDIREKVLGVDHPSTLETCFGLANFYDRRANSRKQARLGSERQKERSRFWDRITRIRRNTSNSSRSCSRKTVEVARQHQL